MTMAAKISFTMKTETSEEAQKLLDNIFKKLLSDGSISSYSFEIETEGGVVTEKCIISEGKVIA